MADKFTRFLSGVGDGILNPKGNLGDNRHAARVFTDDSLSRSPRTKFLFHVYFDINWDAVGAISKEWKGKHGDTVSVLVKNSSLPRFSFDTDVKNQYNRKKMIYKNINYDPVQIKFHDDSVGIINALWALYYGYHSPERHQETAAWSRATGPYTNGITVDEGKFRYGLDRDGVVAPFFNSITIYTMSQRRFNSYKLVNPYIRTWDHGQVDYASSGETIEASMDIGYESVLYGAGVIDTTNQNDPKAFGDALYDKVPSPLSILGGAQSSLFGPGGILSDNVIPLAGAKQIFGANFQEGISSPNNIGAAIGAINTIRSLSNINSSTLETELLNISRFPERVTNVTSGLPGVTFGQSNRPKQ